ncbi:MAG: TonB-dependent receptor, partial [Xanthomonadales bacterium]|nr:TonB-dependent receptor [Xanthomonadales bacterium]NIX12218.1 TonB-dependent receptor [Xanthomonadales bacterium]
VGGPYTVQVSSDAHGDMTVSDIYTRLGDTYSLPLNLGASTMEEVVVTATMVQTEILALGPASSFGLEDLEDYPAINRDIRDVIRFDPRIYQDQAFVGAIQCGGANPRYNSLTVDGVRMNDGFGLNSNGYPTQRQPFPYDSIQEVAVELAPFDVQYGGFTACNINAVTKSGENEFYGSAFYDYTSDAFRGDKLEGDTIDPGDYSEDRYGFSIGGPIVKDKLFFFAAYEKLEGAQQFDRGPAGSGRGREVLGVSQAQYDEILSIAQNVFGFDPGGLPSSLPVEDEKHVVKIDWNINDDHRAAYAYNWNDGFSISQSDGDSDELEFSNHYYERGAELTAHTLALFSDWTDNFTTEVRVSNTELDNRQISLGGTDFGEVQIRTYNDHDGDGFYNRATVYLGGDDSRQSNKLYYEVDNYKLAGAWSRDNHLLTFGYEREELEVFNLFLQHSQTENRHDEECRGNAAEANGCIDSFREARPDDIYYGNAAGTNDPNDVAATWGYAINTWYVQDEMTIADKDLTLVFGLRYDEYQSSDVPRQNDNFVARYGYTNAMSLDGKDLLQPRFGFNWDVNESLSVRGGIGLYSGGNPNVWLSNAYSTDGITQVQVRESATIERACGHGRDFSLFDIPLDGTGRPYYDIPQCMIDAVANGTADSGVNALAPDFEVPSQWKYALGFTYEFDLPGKWGTGYTLTGDILYTDSQDSAQIINSTLEQIGTAPDGRPQYQSIDRADPDCSDPTSGSCGERDFNGDYILTNVTGPDANSTVLSLGLRKSHDSGWDWSFGYSYTDSEDVTPMTSSVAFSNYANVAVDDPNNPTLAVSNYNIPHRFTFRVSYENEWWGDNRSKFSLFVSANEGRPYSYVFSDNDGESRRAPWGPFGTPNFGDWINDRHLLYVPTGPSDPNVVFDADFNQDAFFDFVNSSGLAAYAGGIAPRNAFNSGWWTNMDFRFEQEFPAFREGHKFAGFVVISNICNLINDDWCTLKEVSFPRLEDVVVIDGFSDGQYVFEEFVAPGGEARRATASLYEIRVGLRYDF